jgi:hypothetical protein
LSDSAEVFEINAGVFENNTGVFFNKNHLISNNGSLFFNKGILILNKCHLLVEFSREFRAIAVSENCITAARFWGRSSAYGKEPTFDPNDLRHAISKQPTRLSLEGDER